MQSIDLGKKSLEGPGACLAAPTSPKDPEKYYPSLYLDGFDLGDIPKEGTMTISYRLKSITHRDGDSGESHSCELEVRSIDDIDGADEAEPKQTTHDDFESRMKKHLKAKNEDKGE